MKGHVEIGHLTKYDAFRVNREQAMDLEIQFKIQSIQKSLILTTVKSYYAPSILKKMR